MKRILAALLALCLLLPAGAMAQEVVNVFNWEDYIDESVLELFEQETGIHVNYMCFTQNEDMIVQVEANPGAFDLVFPSEYMVERLMNKGLLAEINYDKQVRLWWPCTTMEARAEPWSRASASPK